MQVRRDAALHFEQRLDCQQAIVADVHMAANREQPLRHGHVAIGHRAIDQRLLGEVGFQFAPQRDAFEQGARGVQARQAERQRGIHMEVRVDERWRDQPAPRIDLLHALHRKARLDRREATVHDPDVDVSATVGKAGVADDEVHDGSGKNETS